MNSSHRPNRYRTSQGIEGEYEPGSRRRVLRNLAGISSSRTMSRAEFAALESVQQRYLSIISAETRFTAELICQMHRDWLGHLYEWAGRYRTVEMAKGSFHWPPAMFVAANMEQFEHGTLARYTPCRKTTVPKVMRRMAEVQAELILIHPFREGNGRMARWITDLMALQAGLPSLNYAFFGKGGRQRRTEYLNAVIRGYSADYEPLEDFLERALRRVPDWRPSR